MTLSREDDYRLAFKLACETLLQSDIEERCLKGGAVFQKKGSEGGIITMEYLNKTCQIQLPRVEIVYRDEKNEVPLWSKILILHYLNTARGDPLANDLITFKEIPSGSFYDSSFIKRSKEPLIKVFGDRPKRLIEAAKSMGGHPIDQGDTGTRILAFPRLPVSLVLWQGDDELTPGGNILFDSTVTHYLPTEDIVVLTQMIVIQLIRNMKEGDHT